MAYAKIYKGMRQLTPREIKAFVMEQEGLTSEEYQKLYDRTRNRVRNYERYTGEQIGNVANYLYMLSADKKYGREHYGARQKELITHAPSASTGTSLEKIKESFDPVIDAQVRRDFAGMIEKDPVSKQLSEKLSGKELKDALEERAEQIHEAMRPSDDDDEEDPFYSLPGVLSYAQI